ncbi:unnamed protein product, partial [Staurois parvus]
PDSAFPQDDLKFLQHKFLIQTIIFSRCSDKAPTVRSKALSCLAQFLEKNAVSEGVQELLQGSSSHTRKTIGVMRPSEVSEASDQQGTDGSCRAMSGTNDQWSLVNGTEASNHTRKTCVLRTIEVLEASDQLGAD